MRPGLSPEKCQGFCGANFEGLRILQGFSWRILQGFSWRIFLRTFSHNNGEKFGDKFRKDVGNGWDAVSRVLFLKREL